ncbi:hypothetical protein ABZ260_24855 [Streptosporangium sp. NPDC006013]
MTGIDWSAPTSGMAWQVGREANSVDRRRIASVDAVPCLIAGDLRVAPAT